MEAIREADEVHQLEPMPELPQEFRFSINLNICPHLWMPMSFGRAGEGGFNI